VIKWKEEGKNNGENGANIIGEANLPLPLNRMPADNIHM